VSAAKARNSNGVDPNFAAELPDIAASVNKASNCVAFYIASQHFNGQNPKLDVGA
jgi:hypothetical protein